ncbi:MAG TPA: hypothetical protein VEF53_18980 [Patescibacteria group bacterium]|nr:hypothetical protein [Patescibacteria group bacterium]
MEYTIIILLLAASIYREHMHHKERQDLYNRIMANSYTEYHKIDKPPPKAPQSKFIKVLHPEKEGE